MARLLQPVGGVDGEGRQGEQRKPPGKEGKVGNHDELRF
ncbi:hypothetical protein FHS53_000622 [Xanthobacter tagetidis]|nr:hypothetical protein [Xanthobacter tagetidis]